MTEAYARIQMNWKQPNFSYFKNEQESRPLRYLHFLVVVVVVVIVVVVVLLLLLLTCIIFILIISIRSINIII